MPEQGGSHPADRFRHERAKALQHQKPNPANPSTEQFFPVAFLWPHWRKLIATIENIPRQPRHRIQRMREPRNRGPPLRIISIDLGTHEIGPHGTRLLLVQ